MGGQTTRIRLATGILILPQRNPLIVAKEAATLDRLTGGRLMLGVGVAWLREEFDALGLPFEGRGARTDEYIEALRTVWTADSPTYTGRFVSFTGATSRPQPVQRGGVPIVVGGHSESAARRAGRLGDGFFPGRGTFERSRTWSASCARQPRKAGRDPDAVEITCAGGYDVDAAERLADLGVSRIVVPPPGFDVATLDEQLPQLGEPLIAPLA